MNERHFFQPHSLLLFFYLIFFNLISILTDPSVSMISVNGSSSGTQTLSIGVNVDVQCNFNDVTSDSIVQWSVDGTPITENIVTADNRTSSILTLSPLTLPGEYRCMVTNSDGQTGSDSVQIFGDINSRLIVVT